MRAESGRLHRIVRDATPADADAIAQLHALSWRTAYRGILTDDYLDKIAEHDRRLDWRTRFSEGDAGTRLVRLAIDDDLLVGFMCAYLDRDEQGGALLDNLHIHPDTKGLGVGRMLMAQAVAWVLEHRPSSSLHLWVYEANHAARGFYERFGGVTVERIVQRACDGRDLPFMRYAWGDLPALKKALGADAAF